LARWSGRHAFTFERARAGLGWPILALGLTLTLTLGRLFSGCRWLYPDSVLRTRVQWSITVLNYMYETPADTIHLVLLLQEEV